MSVISSKSALSQLCVYDSADSAESGEGAARHDLSYLPILSTTLGVHAPLGDGDLLLKGKELLPSKLNVLIVGLNIYYLVSIDECSLGSANHLVHDDIQWLAEQ